jgi:tetratricopeptide (TPR) repeat protein
MKSSNPLYLLLCVLLSLSAVASEPVVTFDSANAAYARKAYDKAIELYERIVADNQQSPELYFNLGNAYYQTGDLAHAILNYERAKRLAPEDEDIAINLKFANQKTEDKIEAAPQMFLVELQQKIVLLMNEKAWSFLCILFLVAGLVLAGVFISSRNIVLKKASFYLGAASLILFIATFFIAKSSYHFYRTHDEAIVTGASVTVLGSPSESSTKLFILHKGSKVVIKEENNGWTEVQIANGNVGWVKETQVEKI